MIDRFQVRVGIGIGIGRRRNSAWWAGVRDRSVRWRGGDSGWFCDSDSRWIGDDVSSGNDRRFSNGGSSWFDDRRIGDGWGGRS